MQIRLSWQFLGALLAFIIALVLLGRFALSLTAPPPPARTSTPSEAMAEAPTPRASVVSPTAPPQPLATSSPAPTTPTPFAATLTATATSEASPTPSSTPEPPPTVTAVPSITPTPSPEAVVVTRQGFVQIAGRLSYAFIVRNPNAELIARDLPFQLIVYDQSGIVLRTDTGAVPVILAGGETSTAQAIDLPAGLQAARIEVLLGDALFVRSVPQPTISFENIAFVPGDPARITGLVRNPLQESLQGLSVVALAFDAGGQIIGSGAAEVPFIPAGGQAAAEVTVAVAGDVASVGLFARPTDLLAP